MPLTFDELTTYDNRRLEPLMRSNAVPAASDLVGYEFRGWNIQALTEVLGTRKFIKGFYGDATSPTAWGYNMPVQQNGRGTPWLPKLKNNQPIRYYFYKVLPGPSLRDAIHPRTLVIDYRQWPEYSAFDPVKYTVDYLVFPDPANGDLVLGKSYSQIGSIRPFLGFFILARLRPSDYEGRRPQP
jgi:hypothetical protein